MPLSLSRIFFPRGIIILSLLLLLLELLSCGGHSSSSAATAPPPPESKEHWDFTRQLMISGKSSPAWSSTDDPRLRREKFDEFYANHKLEVALEMLATNQGDNIFPDYREQMICKDFAQGYTAVAGVLYARRKLDSGAWSPPAASAKAYFSLTKERPRQKFNFNPPNTGNANLTPGHYKLEIDQLVWNGPCLDDPSPYSCGSTGMAILNNHRFPNPEGSEALYYCVNLALSAAWTESSAETAENH